MDYLFTRRVKDPPPEETGRTLKRLWPLIPQEAIAEFKSIGRPYRDRALDRLFAYLHMYYSDNPKLTRHADLAGFLIVPCRTPTLDDDVREMGLEFKDMKEGYWELTGGIFKTYVVEIDRVGDTEPDGVLKSFGHCEELTVEAQRFWANQLGTKEANVDAQKLEGYDEIIDRFLSSLPPERLAAQLTRDKLEGNDELIDRFLSSLPHDKLASKLTRDERLAGLAPQERLAGLAPQERLAGLSRDELLLALPDSELRLLPESYLNTFPEPVREAVRKRLGK